MARYNGKPKPAYKFRFGYTLTAKGHGIWDYREKRLVADGLTEKEARDLEGRLMGRQVDRMMVNLARGMGLVR